MKESKTWHTSWGTIKTYIRSTMKTESIRAFFCKCNRNHSCEDNHKQLTPFEEQDITTSNTTVVKDNNEIKSVNTFFSKTTTRSWCYSWQTQESKETLICFINFLMIFLIHQLFLSLPLVYKYTQIHKSASTTNYYDTQATINNQLITSLSWSVTDEYCEWTN